MINNSSIDDFCFDDDLMKQLLDTTEDMAAGSDQEENGIVIQDVVEALYAEFSLGAAACKEASDQRGQFDADNDALPRSFAASIAATILRLENLMFTFADSAFFDPYEIWDYINRNRRQDCAQVSVEMLEDALVIYLPCLPKRGEGNNALVNQLLASKIYMMPQMPKWIKWEAQFLHVVPSSAARIPRDVDNYDYKKTIDLIAFAIGSADNALNFSVRMNTIFSDELLAGVYVYVTPKSSDFSELEDKLIFLKKRENANKTF